jgi:AAA domain
MSAQPLWLPGPVAVVPSPKAIEWLTREQWQRPGAPDPVGLVAEVSYLSANGGVPARVELKGDTPRLAVYTERYVLWLYVTDYGDGYRLGHLAPVSFRDHERLLRGALLLQSTAGWHAYYHVRDIDVRRRYSAHWNLIAQAWATVGSSEASAALPAHHSRYLDLLAEVVEATRDIEVAKQRTAPPLLYRQRGSTREERHSARGVYAFALARPVRVAPGAHVQVVDRPELRGRIIRAGDREVVVRFEAAVDFSSIPGQGGLQVLPSDRVYQTQLEAIEILKEQRAANPYLLYGLVDRRLSPYRPDTRAVPGERLDRQQLDAFQRALTVPDQLLVLGPPGTGKTRTITQIAASCAARGERVLVTSHTNRAVDNVLERLPAHVRSVRVGNEDAMTSHARAFMVENQVGALKEEILAATEGTVSRLAEVDRHSGTVDGWMDHLSAQLARARAAEDEARARSNALDVLAGTLTAPLRPRIDAAQAALARCQATVANLEKDRLRWRRRLEWAQARGSKGLFAAIVRWLTRRWQRRLAAVERSLSQAVAQLGLAEAEHEAAQAQARDLLARDPRAAELTAARAAAKAAGAAALGDAGNGAAALRGILRSLVTLPPTDPVGLAEWERFRDWLATTVGLLRRRAALLQEWRGRVGESEQDLQRELVRYADVVAATCIGTATTTLLAELQFDLAIVDEAGQISLPNLLVPLVRARRSVLVGDHHQLPPFLDEDVRQWTETLAGSRELRPEEAAEIGDLLRKSAFEQLYGSVGEDHRVMLTVQRRMPEALAQFVSRAFYDNVLRTDHPGTIGDPIFGSPIAMVDTADRPASERAERPGPGSEDWNRHGYVNPLEANLIASLIPRYTRCYRDWAVIVPYRAQADLIGKLLIELLGDARHTRDNVGTVDSFQGGERDLIVYGFTRSNHQGNIGFLKELRRLNVAITRARQQLVLVGDTTTLRQARDQGFAALMHDLVAYLQQAGDLRQSRDVETALGRLAEEGS